jgi:hypothetical protein
MLNKALAEGGLAIVIAGSIFFGGWKVRGWYEGSAALADSQAQQTAMVVTMDSVMRNTEATLARLQKSQDGRTKVINAIATVKKPDAECFDADDLRLLNAVARDEAPTAAASRQVP